MRTLTGPGQEAGGKNVEKGVESAGVFPDSDSDVGTVERSPPKSPDFPRTSKGVRSGHRPPISVSSIEVFHTSTPPTTTAVLFSYREVEEAVRWKTPAADQAPILSRVQKAHPIPEPR